MTKFHSIIFARDIISFPFLPRFRKHPLDSVDGAEKQSINFLAHLQC